MDHLAATMTKLGALKRTKVLELFGAQPNPPLSCKRYKCRSHSTALLEENLLENIFTYSLSANEAEAREN